MRVFILAFFIAMTCSAAQENDLVIVDTARKADIFCALHYLSGNPAHYELHLENRSGRGARIDYRVLSHSISARTGSVVLRPAATDNALVNVVTISMPTGADYFGADITAVTSGTVREIIENRIAADGTNHPIAVLELTPDGPSAAEQEQALIAKNQREETARLRREIEELRQKQDAAQKEVPPAPVVNIHIEQANDLDRQRLWEIWRLRQQYHPLAPTNSQPVTQESKKEPTWEEFRDKELEKERKVWKNP